MSTITTTQQLRSIYKVPSERSLLKELTCPTSACVRQIGVLD